jgi:hypothetical protein
MELEEQVERLQNVNKVYAQKLDVLIHQVWPISITSQVMTIN